jgi:1-acyl-sn-glycerol-3-phosphate acyltransferase
MVKIWAKLLLFISGVRFTVHGYEHIPVGQGFIAACSHTSLLDTFLYPAFLPNNTYYIAKQELAKIPIISQLFRRLGHFFIDRQNPRQAFRSLKEFAAQVPEQANIFIHPEGTRNSNGGILPLKAALAVLALETRKPIVPMVSVNGQRLWPKKSLLPSPGFIDIYIGPPVSTVDWCASERRQNLAMIRSRMQSLLASEGHSANESE